MVYLLLAPAVTAGASVLFGLGLTFGGALGRPRQAPQALALPEIGYPALSPHR